MGGWVGGMVGEWARGCLRRWWPVRGGGWGHVDIIRLEKVLTNMMTGIMPIDYTTGLSVTEATTLM